MKIITALFVFYIPLFAAAQKQQVGMVHDTVYAGTTPQFIMQRRDGGLGGGIETTLRNTDGSIAALIRQDGSFGGYDYYLVSFLKTNQTARVENLPFNMLKLAIYLEKANLFVNGFADPEGISAFVKAHPL